MGMNSYSGGGKGGTQPPAYAPQGFGSGKQGTQPQGYAPGGSWQQGFYGSPYDPGYGNAATQQGQPTNYGQMMGLGGGYAGGGGKKGGMRPPGYAGGMMGSMGGMPAGQQQWANQQYAQRNALQGWPPTTDPAGLHQPIAQPGGPKPDWWTEQGLPAPRTIPGEAWHNLYQDALQTGKFPDSTPAGKKAVYDPVSGHQILVDDTPAAATTPTGHSVTTSPAAGAGKTITPAGLGSGLTPPSATLQHGGLTGAPALTPEQQVLIQMGILNPDGSPRQQGMG